MYRLSGFDAGLLSFESRSHSMNACTLVELDTSTLPGGYSFERFRDNLAVRIRAVPELRAKLADSALNFDTPVWVEDRDFDLDQHLHVAKLSSHGDQYELSEVVGRLAATPLDRRMPLWDMWVIEGSSSEGPPQKVTLLFRVHHVLMDGVTGRDLWSRLRSTDPDPPAPESVGGIGSVTQRRIALDGFVRFAIRPWLLFTGVLPHTLVAVLRTIRRFARRHTMAGPFTAPRTPFNGNVTAHRNVAFVGLDLEDVKTVKNKFGVKVNDVVLALASGTLRPFLQQHGALPERALIAIVPMADAVHDKRREGRNQLSPVFCRLHTDLADPAERLSAIGTSTSVAKDHSSAIGPTLLQDWTQCIPSVMAMFMRFYTRTGLCKILPLANLTLTNVRGSEGQLYLGGAAIRATYPLGPLVNGVALNISAVSQNGTIHVGLVSCPQLLPDLWEVANGLPLALKELLDAANA
jgi:diacylglycerol O-acyltransferase